MKNNKRKSKYQTLINQNKKKIFPTELSKLNLTPDMFWYNEPNSKKDIDHIKKYGYKESELYSLFITISLFVYPRLIEFRKTFHGYPGDLSSEKDWEAILDKMILAFRYVIEDEYDVDLTTGESVLKTEGDVVIDSETRTMNFDRYHCWVRGNEIGTDEYTKDMQTREDIINEGLTLFATWFRSIWD